MLKRYIYILLFLSTPVFGVNTKIDPVQISSVNASQINAGSLGPAVIASSIAVNSITPAQVTTDLYRIVVDTATFANTASTATFAYKSALDISTGSFGSSSSLSTTTTRIIFSSNTFSGSVNGSTVSISLTNVGVLNGTQTWTGQQVWNNPGLSTFTYAISIGSAIVQNFIDMPGTPDGALPPSGTVRLHAMTTNGITRLEQDNVSATDIVLGRDTVFIARNTSGAILNPLQLVYVTGSTGNIPNVSLAIATTTARMPVACIVVDTVAVNAYFQCMRFGVLKNVNTSTFATGDILYLSTDTLGGLTNIRPIYPQFEQRIGNVLVSGTGNGSIFVTITAFIGGTEDGTISNTFQIGASTTTEINLNAVGISTFPYNVTAGSFTATGWMDFNAQASNPPSPAAGVARFHSSTTQGFTRFEQDNEAATNITLGRDNVYIGKNVSGTTLTPLQVVYVNGQTGGAPNVDLAIASTTARLPAYGVVMDTITPNNFGQIMLAGVLKNVNTNAFAVGASLYVSPTSSGALTSTRPAYPNYAERIGTVLASGIGNGSVLVFIAPFLGDREVGTTSDTFTIGSSTNITVALNAVGTSTFTYAVKASSFIGDGSNLTAIPAAQISAGSLGSSVIASSIAVNSVGSSQISGPISIAKGGTNSTTALSNGLVMVSSNGAIVEAQVSTTTLYALNADSPTYTVNFLIVAGGGGGGFSQPGGGGAGGMIEGSTTVVVNTAYTVTVGTGGVGLTGGAGDGSNGMDSSFNGFTAIGGGAGGATANAGHTGGSGGGAAQGAGTFSVGTANQGSGGGAYNGGGGGAGGFGLNGYGSGTDTAMGFGGPGRPSTITGQTVYYAGGGAGYPRLGGIPSAVAKGGIGGGGDTTVSGTANTGGGGGADGGTGGSGIVIISYRSPIQRGTGGNTITSYGVGHDITWVHKFTSSGTFTPN